MNSIMRLIIAIAIGLTINYPHEGCGQTNVQLEALKRLNNLVVLPNALIE